MWPEQKKGKEKPDEVKGRRTFESLASENASRLASMQAAEKNIEEQLSEIKNQLHQIRQMAITEELLDIVAGFEALRREDR
jgi:F-type H+-transporting ATPase subunit gamma